MKDRPALNFVVSCCFLVVHLLPRENETLKKETSYEFVKHTMKGNAFAQQKSSTVTECRACNFGVDKKVKVSRSSHDEISYRNAGNEAIRQEVD